MVKIICKYRNIIVYAFVGRRTLKVSTAVTFAVVDIKLNI